MSSKLLYTRSAAWTTLLKMSPQLSPFAHAPCPMPPRVFFDTLESFGKSNLKLAETTNDFKNVAAEFGKSVENLGDTIQITTNETELLAAKVQEIAQGPSLVQTSTNLQTHINTFATQTQQLQENTQMIANRLRDKMSPEMAANLRARLTGQ